MASSHQNAALELRCPLNLNHWQPLWNCQSQRSMILFECKAASATSHSYVVPTRQVCHCIWDERLIEGSMLVLRFSSYNMNFRVSLLRRSGPLFDRLCLFIFHRCWSDLYSWCMQYMEGLQKPLGLLVSKDVSRTDKLNVTNLPKSFYIIQRNTNWNKKKKLPSWTKYNSVPLPFSFL